MMGARGNMFDGFTLRPLPYLAEEMPDEVYAKRGAVFTSYENTTGFTYR